MIEQEGPIQRLNLSSSYKNKSRTINYTELPDITEENAHIHQPPFAWVQVQTVPVALHWKGQPDINRGSSTFRH